MKNLDFVNKYLAEYNFIKRKINLSPLDTFRGLMNITTPVDLTEKYYQCQDEILQEVMNSKNITNVNDIEFIKDKMCLWKGDITTLEIEAIVNAANPTLQGCFKPLHNCVDNVIHSYAGLQVRRDLMEIIEEQGYEEPCGLCKVTNGYNLKCKYIFHTVGPFVVEEITENNINDLKNCYLSCLSKADELNITSIAFCSISTGEYNFDKLEACQIAVETVKSYLENNNTNIEKVVFCVYDDFQYEIYLNKLSETKEETE